MPLFELLGVESRDKVYKGCSAVLSHLCPPDTPSMVSGTVRGSVVICKEGFRGFFAFSGQIVGGLILQKGLKA